MDTNYDFELHFTSVSAADPEFQGNPTGYVYQSTGCGCCTTRYDLKLQSAIDIRDKLEHALNCMKEVIWQLREKERAQ